MSGASGVAGRAPGPAGWSDATDSDAEGHATLLTVVPARGRTVDVHIHRLRRKLGPGYARYVVTVRRVGYTFQPPRLTATP